MVTILDEKNSIANKYLAELRDVNIQSDRLRFRKNVERLGQIMAYELSKSLAYEEKEVETPLGSAITDLPADRIIVASILRAGLPLHMGLLSYFDEADNAFVSAYRKHHKDGTFEINLEYVTCPNLDDAILIITDPMLATGSSFHAALQVLADHGKPKETHLVTLIAATDGVSFIQRMHSEVHLWLGSVDDELTAKSYIVPGLGDAGDLLFGEKLQD